MFVLSCNAISVPELAKETLTKTAKPDTSNKRGVYNALFVLQNIQTKGNLKIALLFLCSQERQEREKTKGIACNSILHAFLASHEIERLLMHLDLQPS